MIPRVPASRGGNCRAVRSRLCLWRGFFVQLGLPTFLGISPPRTGSTWLHEVLDQHPQIQMTRPKECAFFGKRILYRDLEWYRQRFAAAPGAPQRPIRGDISPWYARLSDASIRAAKALLPDAKILLVLRNPIERSWSQALLELGYLRKIPLDRLTETSLLLHFERLRVVRYSEYLMTIRRWSAVFGSKALHIALHDDLSQRPREFLKEILRHIGADPDWRPSDERLCERVFTTRAMTGGEGCRMSEFVRWYLAMQWLGPTRELNHFLDGRLDGWVRQMEQATRTRVPRSWRIKRQIHRSVLRWPRDWAYCAYDAGRELALTFRNWVVLSQPQEDGEGEIAPVGAAPGCAAARD